MGNTLPRVNVIGMGEVGRRLADALLRAGIETKEVTRDHGWPQALQDHDGLYLVCVREEVLRKVLERIGPGASDRIILVQNGWIRPEIRDFPNVTRGLIWFTAKGEFFRVPRPSPFAGPWAVVLAAALSAGDLPSLAVDSAAFDRLDAEKMGLNCVIGLPLAVHGLSLGEYLEEAPEEAREVFREAVSVCASALGAETGTNLWEEFIRVAAPLDWVRVGRAKALEFRNGAVVALAEKLGLEAPVNAGLLREYTSRDLPS